ncbi:MAG TPA: ABC transporter permease [Rhizobiaceae bacterium]|nr:ABC transporter permease [Rhizobiaceae bacterium]
MLAYAVRRVVATIPVMLIVAVITFLLLALNPGDPAAILAGEDATTADIDMIRESLGLDQPMPVQFVKWITGVVTGDLGMSIFHGRPVLEMLMARLEPTAMVALATILISVLIAVPLGVIAAWQAGTWIDRAIMVFAVASFSIPVFLVGYFNIYVFSMQMRVLPVQGYVPLAQGIIPCLTSLILPSATLGLAYSALLARMTRSTMLEVLNEDYIRTARAKGLSISPVLIKHALRNAAVPIVTTIGVAFASLLGGVVVTESVFAIPGIGRMTVEAILQRDIPVVQGVVLFAAFTCIMVNLIIDISYSLFDPRIRY